MTPMTDLRKAAWLALLVPLALLCGAFASERMGLVACEMCWWQRWAHMYALPPAATALVFQTRRLREGRTTLADRNTRFWAVAAACAVLASGLIGAYHAGVEYGWWIGHTACTTAAPGGTTLTELSANLATTPLIRCDQAQWTLMGISLAGWNALVSTTGAVVIARLCLKDRRS